MTPLIRLLRLGLLDADARIARALSARPSGDADRYLASSATVRSVDRLAHGFLALWQLSATQSMLAETLGWAPDRHWRERYESLGWILVVGVATHVTLTMARGPRPGWFWLLIPMMAMSFGVLLLAASRSAD